MSASMWPRYRSSARRPAAVSRYSVLGIRPSNDLAHVMYCASSSRRAWTLKLPSVVLSRALSWLKLRASFTASALTMPRRTRSWISRSSSAARDPPRSLFRPCSTASVFLAAPCLATVPPSNDHPEHDVETAEPRGHETVRPRRRPEQRHGADEHEADPHDGDDPDRKRAPRHEPRAVQQQPRAGERVRQAGAVQHHGQETADHHRGQKTQAEPSPRPGQDGIVHRVRLPDHGRAADRERHDRFTQPGGEPQLWRALARGEERRGERGGPDRHLSPARHRGERSRALHRLPDEAEVVERAVVQRPGSSHDVRWRGGGPMSSTL